MKVYCVDNVLNPYSKCRLTIGKSYEILHQVHCNVTVRNDAGKRASYGTNRFATVEQLRDMRLKEILNSD